jgi:hypothetical protein
VTFWHAAEFVALVFVSTLLWILTWSGLKSWKDKGFEEWYEYVIWLIVATLAVLATAGALVV